MSEEVAEVPFSVWNEGNVGKPTYDDWFFICNHNDGKTEEVCMEDVVLAWLLREEEIYPCAFITGGWPEGHENNGVPVVGLVIGCNDVFAWACADSEEFSHADIPEIAKFYLADPKWGLIKWVMKKRNQQPQGPIIRRMKEQGAWDDFCESIGANTLDAEVYASICMASAKMKGGGAL